MLTQAILWSGSLTFVIAIWIFMGRAARQQSVVVLLHALTRSLDDKSFKWSLLKFGEFVRAGSYKPASEQFDVVRLVLLCMKNDAPCFHIRFETVSLRGHYRCLISQDVPGLRWRTIGCRGLIGDAVWVAFMPFVNGSTDVGLRHARPKLVLLK